MFFSSSEHKVLRVSYCDRPLSVVRRRASSVVRRASPVVRHRFYLNIFSSETAHWILTKRHRIPRWSSTKVFQTVPVGCISRSQGQKIGFQNAIFKNHLVWNYKAQSSYIWYIASSRGPLQKLFKLCPWGSKLTPARKSQFYIELYKKNFKWLLILNR